jgi:hypothetical protein
MLCFAYPYRNERGRRGGLVPQCKSFQLRDGKVAPISPPMTYGARFFIITAFVFCPIAQLLAEDKEPFAVVELRAAMERSVQEGTYSVGPAAGHDVSSKLGHY